MHITSEEIEVAVFVAVISILLLIIVLEKIDERINPR